MALLAPQSGPTNGEISSREKRNTTLSTKLTEAEFAQVLSRCNSRQLAPSEWLRDLILRELRGDTDDTKRDELMLAELVGLRLMFINLLKPRDAKEGPLTLEVFDSILQKIKGRKSQLAQEMLGELEVNGEHSVG